MSSSLLYSLALFFHILAAFGLIAAITLEAVSQRGLRQAATAEAARTAIRPLDFVAPLGAGSALLILVTGIYMMATAWGLQGWIAVALAGLILNALSGALVTRSRIVRLRPVLAASGSLSPPAQLTLGDPVLRASLRLRLGVVLGILFLMTVKPSAIISVAIIVLAATTGVATALIPSRRYSHELRPENS